MLSDRLRYALLSGRPSEALPRDECTPRQRRITPEPRISVHPSVHLGWLMHSLFFFISPVVSTLGGISTKSHRELKPLRVDLRWEHRVEHLIVYNMCNVPLGSRPLQLCGEGRGWVLGPR